MRSAVLLLVLALASPAVAQAANPGTNGDIAFARYAAGAGTSIWTVGPTGGAPEQLTTGIADSDPAWSPDGKRLAFAAAGTLCTVDADGSDRNCLSLGPDSQAGAPTWSPDGTRIAVAVVAEDDVYAVTTRSLWVASATLADAEPVLVGHQVSSPSWSPDGTRIAFSGRLEQSGSDPSAPRDLLTVKPDGTGVARITDSPAIDEARPDWAPDGARLAYERNYAEIWSVQASGAGDLPVGDGTAPAYSPDGTKVVAVRQDYFYGGGNALVVFPSAGGTGTEITDGSFFADQPSWQPGTPGNGGGGGGGEPTTPAGPDPAPATPISGTGPEPTTTGTTPGTGGGETGRGVGAQAAGALAGALPGRVGAGKLLGGLALRFTASGPGVASVVISAARPRAGASAAKARRIVIAKGRKVTAGGRTTVLVKPTRKGRKLLRKGKRLRAKARLRFDPTSGPTVTRTARLTIKRRG